MSNCIQEFENVGIGLNGSSLSGSFSFVFDTTHYDSFIKKIEYSTNSFPTSSQSVSGYFQVTNYQCDFNPSQYIPLTSTPYYVSALNLSGRYVLMHFDLERTYLSALSPRVYDFNVDFSYNKKEYEYNSIYKLASDIYGFEYALLKPDLDVDLYTYHFTDGEMFIKDFNGKVETLSDSLTSTFTQYSTNPTLYSQMTTGVFDFECFFDTLMFVTSNFVVFEKLNYSFESNELTTDPTNSRVLNLTALSSLYGDIWLFENESKVLTFMLDENTYYPKIFNMDVVNSNFYEVSVNNKNILDELSAVDIVTIEKPVISYDGYRKVFNIGALFLNSDNEANILSINLDYRPNNCTIRDYSVISSVDYGEV